MEIPDYLLVRDPALLAFAVAIILFALAYVSLIRVIRNKGITLIISLIIALIVAWNLYRGKFYGWESVIAVLLIIVVAVILLKILWAFVKNVKVAFGHYIPLRL